MIPPSIARARLRLWAFWFGTVATLAALIAIVHASDECDVEICAGRTTPSFECASEPSAMLPPWTTLALFGVVAGAIEIGWRRRMMGLRARGEMVVDDAPIGYRQAPPRRRRFKEQAAFSVASAPTELRMAATFGLAHALLLVEWSMTRPVWSHGWVGTRLGLEHPGWIWSVVVPMAIVVLAQLPIRRRIVGPIADLIEPLNQARAYLVRSTPS